LNDSQKAIFVLTLTSNSGTDDFLARPFANQNSMAEYIAQKLSHINAENPTEVGMVVGATQALELEEVINHHPKSMLLIPGIGTQGGSLEELKNVLDNHQGIPLINSSRSILYAGEHADDWQQAVADKALEFKNALQPITDQYV
jgi:orotidine-5'-phosphate decarboxylase